MGKFERCDRAVVRCRWSVALSILVETVMAKTEPPSPNSFLANSFFNGQRTTDNGHYRIWHRGVAPRIYHGALDKNRKAFT